MATTYSSSLTVLHDRLALALAVFVPLSAVPLASNRATLWLVWTALLALLAMAVYMRSWQLAPQMRPRLARHGKLFLLALALPVWAAVQLLPLAQSLPAALLNGQAGLPASPTISVLPDAGPAGILRFAGYALLAALVLEIATRRERILFFSRIIFAGIVAQAIWAMIALQLLGDMALWGPKTAYPGSATGTFVNRNSLATFLSLGLVLGCGLVAEAMHKSSIRTTRTHGLAERLGYDGIFTLLGMGFILVTLVATQSRLGLVAGLAGLGTTALLLRLRSDASPARLLSEAVAALLVLGGLLALLGGGGVGDRLILTGADGDYRLALYRQTLGMIGERPWLGYGMDTFGAAFEGFRAPPLDAPVSYDLAHNTYLALWAEFGFVFGSIPLVVLLLVAVRLGRRMRDPQGCAGIAAAGIGALVLSAIHSLGDFSFEIPANVYLLVAILGAGLGKRGERTGRRPALAGTPKDTAVLTLPKGAARTSAPDHRQDRPA